MPSKRKPKNGSSPSTIGCSAFATAIEERSDGADQTRRAVGAERVREERHSLAEPVAPDRAVLVDHHLDDALVRERVEDHLAELAVELLAEAPRAHVARVVELLRSPHRRSGYEGEPPGLNAGRRWNLPNGDS